MENSWDGQVDKHIPKHVFALKLSKASWKAGRTKGTEERCSSEKREKPKCKLSCEGTGTTTPGIIWSMRDQLSSVKSCSLPSEQQQQQKR